MTIPQKLAREISQEICNFNTIRNKEKEPIMIYAKHLEELVQKVLEKYWSRLPDRAEPNKRDNCESAFLRGWIKCYDAFMAAFEVEEPEPKKKKVPEKLEDSIIRLNGAQRSLHLDELTALKVNEIIEFLSEEKS